MTQVVHVIIGLNVGGAELMLKRLIESHQDNPKYRHSVISITLVGKVGTQLQEIGVEVRALGMCSLMDIPRVLLQLVRMIRAERPDIVQTWMYHADLLGGLAARLAGNRRVIWGVRTTDVESGGKRVTLWVRQVCAWLSRRLPYKIVCAAD
ncbi:MAG: glycosyltransferase, partial [Nitrososphaera sp.]